MIGSSSFPPPEFARCGLHGVRSGRRRNCIVLLFVGALIAISTGALVARAAMPGFAEFSRAQAAFRAHRYATAAYDYQMAIAHGYQDAGAFYQLGLCFSYQRRWSFALWSYNRTLAIEPKYGFAHPELYRRRYQALIHGGRDRPPPILGNWRLVIPASGDNPRQVEPLHAHSIAATQVPSTRWLQFWPVPVFIIGCATANWAWRRVMRVRSRTRPAYPPHLQDDSIARKAILNESNTHVAAPPASNTCSAVAAAESVQEPLTGIHIAEVPAVADAAPQVPATVTPKTAPIPLLSLPDLSVLLVRPSRMLLRCPRQLPRRPGFSLLDELRHVRTLLSGAPNATQFVQQMLLWPGLLLPRLASIEELGAELLRTYYVVGLIERTRRTNSKVVKDTALPQLSDVALCTYCGVHLCLRLAGMGEMLDEFARGAMLKEQTFVGFCPPAKHARPWDSDEVQQRLRLLDDLGLVRSIGTGYRATPLLQDLALHVDALGVLAQNGNGRGLLPSAEGHTLPIVAPGRTPTKPGATARALPHTTPASPSEPDDVEALLDLLLKPERRQAHREGDLADEGSSSPSRQWSYDDPGRSH